jgi:hypothetical protein
MVLGVGIAGAIFTSMIAKGESAIQNILPAHPIFFKAIQTSFAVASIFALIGALTSLARDVSVSEDLANEK